MRKIAKSVAGIFLILFFSCNPDTEFEPVPNPDFVYFLVEDPAGGNNDSYILPLVNPEHIAQARAMIADPANVKIVLAEITKDPRINYYRNKDLLNNKNWSWHVAEFLGFYDTTIEIYDGWPQYVEDNYTEWVKNTKGSGSRGIIGFWSYYITREVPASELY
jgi:hypothetical protein